MGDEQDLFDQKRPAEVAGDRLVAKTDESEARIIARIDRLEAGIAGGLNVDGSTGGASNSLKEVTETMTELASEMRLLNRITFIILVLTIIISVKLWWP
jgi:hypothetical protein